ncbi:MULTISPECIES: c-type cytochrome biogenesis protein CcsB [Paenibacillus]|uniref:c-type cytochrome biogenesis protein CcsB n=1 Tax=Paenibacillus TaxID=44249 RepID=UPI000433A39D|nr:MULTISPECIES: c-type cytochrome biogenesis protein CcsB [Paenibacillus]KKC46226.1 cytochrome C biogenesis protein [Paenibacillus sp. D9]CDN42801.1 Cytochrome c biogenesis protein ResC [Paenibacillus sp. P22]
MNWLDFSSSAFVAAFFLYCFGFLFFVTAIVGRRWSHGNPDRHEKRWGNIAFVVSVLGLAAHLLFFITRWVGGGHIPISNMYEFMTFLGMAIMVAFTIIYLIYRKPILGMFALPLVVIIVAYASVFPQEVQPLIPALNSYWLKIHVTTAALGEAFLAVGFAAGLLHLLRTIDFAGKSEDSRKERLWIEVTMFMIVVAVGFIVTVFAFRAAGYEAQFTQENVQVSQAGEESSKVETVKYSMPPIVKPFNSTLVHMDSFLGIKQPVLEAPSWMNGINAGRKLNTVIWSFLSGLILYGILRLVLRRTLSAAIHPYTTDIDPDDLDEISYRAIAIGFPIFTLGALIFAMIWASIAWSRFWGWDPKEVWALITWLYYSAYLHLRLSRGWHGKRSSWLTVIGFLIIMFTLVGVNLVIAGLHSYAGA